MTDDEIIDVVFCHKEGKKIEYRELYLRENGRWLSADGPDLWDFRNRRYRVAPDYLSVYCFPKDLHPTPRVGMIKVQQVELEKGENPLPRKPIEWEVWESPSGALNVVDPCRVPYIATFRVREVIEGDDFPKEALIELLDNLPNTDSWQDWLNWKQKVSEVLVKLKE